ncbi:MAG TPA: type IX secretion system membrane protein PorP/SprF [Cytophagales bacterium]|nr:type IX secretion system membrane protein PorP/SprF [Cytophagales bacterium]
MRTNIGRRLLVSITGLLGFSAVAQQQGQFSMYMINQYIANPAVAGTEDYIDAKVGFRAQWFGLQDAPKSYYATVHGPVKKNINHKQYDDVKPLPWHSAGFTVTGEETGVLNKNSIFGTYAYHIPLSSKLNLSLGASAGVQQYRVKVADLKYDPQGNIDKATAANTSVWSPDGNVGIWMYTKKLYFGVSSMQVFNKKIDLASNADAASRLNRHFFVTGGYKIKLDSSWALVPSFMFKAVSPTPAQIDLNCKVRYQDKFWGGISWRNRDAFVFIIGMTLDEKYDIGYSYDYTTSQIGHFSSGSHEVVLGYRIPHLRHKPAPAQFW